MQMTPQKLVMWSNNTNETVTLASSLKHSTLSLARSAVATALEDTLDLRREIALDTVVLINEDGILTHMLSIGPI